MWWTHHVSKLVQAILDSYNPGQKSLGQYFNIHIFLSFLGSLLKQFIIFEIFSQFSLPPPYTKLKLGKKFWIHSSNIVCGVREGVGPVSILENAPETHWCLPRLLSMIVGILYNICSLKIYTFIGFIIKHRNSNRIMDFFLIGPKNDIIRFHSV